MIKKIGIILGIGLALYVGFFALWLLMIMACIESGAISCGGDTMTETVRVLYSPVIEVLF